jgi:mono/diheme cytochrome c family protein
MRRFFGHPFWQAALLLAGAYVLFKYGIAYLPPLLGARSAPVPTSVVLQFMLIALVGILVYVSSEEERWHQFKQPIHSTLVEPDKKWLRAVLMVVLPLGVGYATFAQARPRVAAPISLRSIHPAPPGQITFRGKSIQLTGLQNPLHSRGSPEEHYRNGRKVYYQNCLPCHGDLLDGKGHFGHGFSPTPLPFDDPGTIAQLSESYVFWRIAKGGPGLPREGTPWNSAMPVWEDILTEDEIWSVIIFLYQQSGFQPRREGEATEAEGGAH